MFSFLKRILPQRVLKKANIPARSSSVRLLRSEVNKHLVKDTGKFFYSKLDFFVDDQDPVWECINGYHTCAVDSQIDFEQAKSMSKAFTFNKSDMDNRENYKSLEHKSLIHPLEDVRGSWITWRLHDGSFVTEHLTYRRPRKKAIWGKTFLE